MHEVFKGLGLKRARKDDWDVIEAHSKIIETMSFYKVINFSKDWKRRGLSGLAYIVKKEQGGCEPVYDIIIKCHYGIMSEDRMGTEIVSIYYYGTVTGKELVPFMKNIVSGLRSAGYEVDEG